MNKLIPLKELFTPVYGVNLELVNIEECEKKDSNSIRFISRTELNNGVSAYVKRINDVVPNPAHTISVAVSGSVLSSFYQDKEYYSGRDLYYLMPKRKTSKEEMIFYALCIKANKYKYNYGRAANKTLKEILLPAEMPNDFKKIMLDQIPVPIDKELLLKQFSLNTQNWGLFALNGMFGITGSKTTPLLELEEYGQGKYPYVTTQATNNGIGGFYDFYTEEGGILTVDSAVFGYCSYQSKNFSASDHVEKLIPKFKMNKYIAMFLVKILNLEQYRYNYGRKCSQDRMNQIKIKLPTKDGQPDFNFMEDYIKSLPYSASI
ncbi:hypothetical protein A2930_04140 [Candidatus Giovannonibacteria bacterium RIFCSPLOWO2_01_FULL_45_34]|uniref:Type I restriction modification DNA specificity domain-containing protein n=1 Tax=Candidatus Giovannonibacteria bacterium RIFCSPLOWO2_01_FULL_45_34 TaxID=1798351 RepID=A0A1F5X181_9BACT|nr:MAG: hypothetical protein A3C73_04585 [Candidatus Giovannonibacteria bacterium RIFCSPHIGHO2_02_FULL_44_11]OGF81659.1 MAG: hypothetical protein A2930_04140 [Candidatus Giovannonibacteria bacterium RIFCSPLOWO2_01_FULL_45_34]